MHAGADDSTGRAAGLGGGFDADPPLPEREDLSHAAKQVSQIRPEGGAAFVLELPGIPAGSRQT
ncbi:hypothetical protein [Arthrobacter ramosus]|uniref:hypothetical protein n=1 Tax=Arthrobacter ramosus TaxID=1672 RepID=UPI001F17B67C|nr:hypothetical protein [Arthrobacter ramosus]